MGVQAQLAEEAGVGPRQAGRPRLVPRGDQRRRALAHLLRLIRRKTGHTQNELAVWAGVPRIDVIRIEAGRAADVKLGRVRRILEAAGGRGRLVPWWNGAAADRLLDERHAALVERAARVFRARGWQTAVELSFAEFGERGSIDIFAAHGARLAIAVCEVKSEFGSLEELNRTLDVKERLAPKLAHARFGWWPNIVGRLLIVPRDNAIRRIVAAHPATMAAAYPARSREVRAWLRQPAAPLRGIWFVSAVPDTNLVRG